jgi:putative transposase
LIGTQSALLALDTSFCVEALTAALDGGQPEYHNSDQGVQFTSDEYLSLLTSRRLRSAWMVVGAWTTSLPKTLEDGKVRHLPQRVQPLMKYVDYMNFTYYNTRRPHQSLGYQAPDTVYYQTIKT